MFHALFALLRGLRGFARGLLALRKLHDIASHLVPTLCSPPPSHFLDAAPIAPLDVLEELTTPSSYGALIAIEVPPQALPSAIPTHIYQSGLVTVTPTHFFDLIHILLLLAFISGLVLLLPGLVYVFATIAGRISAPFRLSTKNSKASSFKPAFRLAPNFVSTPLFLLVSLVSLLLLWTGPVRGPSPDRTFILTKSFQLATASLITLIYIISTLPIYQKFSNKVSIVTHICINISLQF
jgi:hypothetical protein